MLRCSCAALAVLLVPVVSIATALDIEEELSERLFFRRRKILGLSMTRRRRVPTAAPTAAPTVAPTTVAPTVAPTPSGSCFVVDVEDIHATDWTFNACNQCLEGWEYVRRGGYGFVEATVDANGCAFCPYNPHNGPSNDRHRVQYVPWQPVYEGGHPGKLWCSTPWTKEVACMPRASNTPDTAGIACIKLAGEVASTLEVAGANVGFENNVYRDIIFILCAVIKVVRCKPKINDATTCVSTKRVTFVKACEVKRGWFNPEVCDDNNATFSQKIQPYLQQVESIRGKCAHAAMTA